MSSHGGKDGYTLEIVRFKDRCARWGIMAKFHGEVRYRRYHYKKDAVSGMKEWEGMKPMFFEREFYHNFYESEEPHEDRD